MQRYASYGYRTFLQIDYNILLLPEGWPVSYSYRSIKKMQETYTES